MNRAGPVPCHHRPGREHPGFVGNVENLEKRITRAYRRTLFGSLTNDGGCSTVAREARQGQRQRAGFCRESAYRLDRLWSLVQDTCPLPLLDHWRDIVLELLQTRSMLTRLPFALGPLEGHRLAIDVPALTQALGGLIRNALTTTTSGHPNASDLPLEAVA